MSIRVAPRLVAIAALGFATPAFTHESTLRVMLAQANPPLAEAAVAAATAPAVIELTLGDTPVAGLVRVTEVASGKVVELSAHLRRPMGWFSLPPRAAVRLPVGDLRIEACRGLDTEVATTTVSVLAKAAAPQSVRIALQRFYDPAARQLMGANTHLHLFLSNAPGMGGALLRDRREAEDYLRTTGASDGLDLVYVSHLERSGETQRYVSNGFTRDDLKLWSTPQLQFANGEEHRHEGGRSPARGGPDEFRFGHVLFLDLPQLIQPVSYGAVFTPGVLPSDAVPMQRAIKAARALHATIVWCHGTLGTEDVPNWLAGLIDAQNIFDGVSLGTYETIFYPYLNAGLRVPFSTGTDWGIYDFSRAYVSTHGPRTSPVFLDELTRGRSFITNGPFLEFAVDGRQPGETIAAAKPGSVQVRGRAIGRDDFSHLEVVHNGKVVARADCHAIDGHFEASIDTLQLFDSPGWFALRIPTTRPYADRTQYTGPGANLFGKALFAHTSPVYVTIGGTPPRQPAAVQQLKDDVAAAIRTIETKGAFATPAEREALLALYREAMDKFSPPRP